jgi:hypothetical protein
MKLRRPRRACPVNVRSAPNRIDIGSP